MRSLDSIIEELKHYDEVSVLELLDLNSEQVIERFHDVVQKRRKILEEKLDGPSGLTDDLDEVYGEDAPPPYGASRDYSWGDREDNED